MAAQNMAGSQITGQLDANTAQMDQMMARSSININQAQNK
jgi:hypothetical protein